MGYYTVCMCHNDKRTHVTQSSALLRSDTDGVSAYRMANAPGRFDDRFIDNALSVAHGDCPQNWTFGFCSGQEGRLKYSNVQRLETSNVALY